ncbi:MAG TPA: Ig-like domain-containing protein [Gemmatimonadales bacterium]
MTRSKDSWVGTFSRVTAAVLSAGAALVSILSYTAAPIAEATGAEASAAAHRVHRLALTPVADTAAALGDSIQLAALVTDDRGSALLGVAPVWTSADPLVAEVDQAGTVVSRAPGTTAVIVRVGPLEARARITVAPQPAALRFADTLLQVREGESLSAALEVADARGHAVAGAAARWLAADAAVATVDSSGTVQGVSPGRSAITAGLGELRAELPVEVVAVPASITVLEGEGQRAPAGRSLGTLVSAQIVSRTGRPIPGVPATFQARGTEAAAVPAVDTSDARGVVRTVWTLDRVPGRQQLAIAVEGVPVSPVVTAEADPVPADTRVTLASEPAPGTAGDSLADPVTIRVTDSAGVALADLPVAWSTPDGGRLSPLGARTDSLGEAKAFWRLGTRAGRQRVRVQVGNARTMPAFTAMATAVPGPAEKLVVRGGDGQKGRVGQPLARLVVLRALDRAGNPVPDVPLAVGVGAGRIEDTAVRTDSTGQARLRWTLGRAAGPQQLSVALAKSAGKVVVTARAQPGAPARLAFVTAPASAVAKRALEGIVVEVSDSFGNPLPGQRVVLAATSGTVTPTRQVTDTAGRARVRWTPGAKPGKATLTGKVGERVRGSRVLMVTAARLARSGAR